MQRHYNRDAGSKSGTLWNAAISDMDQIGLRKTSLGGYAVLIVALAGLVGTTVSLAATPLLLPRVLAVVVGLLAGVVAFVVFRGGQFTKPITSETPAS